MDPDACLADIQWALTRDDPPDLELATERAQALRQWLRADGFEPDWSKAPEATEFYWERS